MDLDKMSTGKIIVLAIIAIVIIKKLEKVAKAPSTQDVKDDNVVGAGSILGIGGATSTSIAQAKKQVETFAATAAKNKQFPTWKLATVQNQAATLYVAMKGLGTNTTNVKNVFKNIKKDVDFERLFVQFGVKESQNLGQWVGSEWIGPVPLSTLVNGILKDNSIKYRFS